MPKIDYQWFLDKVFPPMIMFGLASMVALFSWLNVRVSALEVNIAAHEQSQVVQEKYYQQNFEEIKQGQSVIQADIKTLIRNQK